MLRNFLIKHKKRALRFFEILPGLISWNLILFPYWGIFLIPNIVAYFILLFNAYWFYQAFGIAFTSILSHMRIQASMHYDWMGDLKKFPDWQKVHHVIIIPTYKEPLHILERTVGSLAAQELPGKQMTVVLATEFKEDKIEREKKARALQIKYGDKFANFIVTIHKLAPGEVVGKSSNERHAALEAKRILITKGKMNINYMTVTSCDADHLFHPKHYSSRLSGYARLSDLPRLSIVSYSL